MKTTKIISRKYHDGIMDRHTKNEWELENSPVYTLYRVESDDTDWSIIPTTYAIIRDYGKGRVEMDSFENLKTAFRVFRFMVGIEFVA